MSTLGHSRRLLSFAPDDVEAYDNSRVGMVSSMTVSLVPLSHPL